MKPLLFLWILYLCSELQVALSFQSAAFCTKACRRRRETGTSTLFAATSTSSSLDTNTVTKQQQQQQQEGNDAVTKPLSIAVVGSGAVGSYYGARLWESGHQVKYLFRNENYEAATTNGLNVTSVKGDVFIPADELLAFDDTSEIGTVDWVLVALKSTSLDAIPDLIYPLLDPDRTRVLVIMNGLIEEDLIAMLKKKAGEETQQNGDDTTATTTAPLECCRALYGGMALVCSNKLGPAVVHHSYAGLLTGGVASSRSPSANDDDPEQDDDRAAFFNLWRGVDKVDIAYEDSLLRGRWQKMVWNLPFNGISVAMGGITIDRVVNDPSLRDLSYKVMDETIAAANADLEHMYGPGNFEPLGQAAKDQMMTLSDNMGPYKTSTLLDLVNRRPMEVKYMFRKPVERARKLGVPVPHLETLVAQIEAFQRHYRLF